MSIGPCQSFRSPFGSSTAWQSCPTVQVTECCGMRRRSRSSGWIDQMTGRGNSAFERELHTLAARQWQDYRRLVPGTYFSESHAALDLDQAYAVQTEIARLRCAAGDAVAGYKIGCIGPG